MQFTVVRGDIAKQEADVLVNAAGTSLRMGSGVAGALRRGAGEAINEAAMAKGPIDLGRVAVTEAYDLDSEWVIHAAAMPHYGDGEATEGSIRAAMRNALERAEALGAESLVTPALGCGVAGFPLAEGAGLICEELAAHDADSLADVRVIAYSTEEFETIRSVAEAFAAFRPAPDDQR